MIETRNLILSMDWLCETNLSKIISRDQFNDFLNYYIAMKKSLQEFAEENNSKFISIKLKELPQLDNNDYYDNQSFKASILLSFFVWIPFFNWIPAIIAARKNANLANKLNIINASGNSILEVLKHPGMDELIMSSGNYKI